ncbi:RNB domain [Carpediemonas membranifera]|uniref:RNB domain n=1 Tax=Carpediemonas membranifera TaxID=201153 RepID=A0A8J6AST8_9EUKA|nr:RNB domain [Carpediemonas membranifera]|eukprot:KAG9391490.1 RNB domain [Carpediemonas membranifera]
MSKKQRIRQQQQAGGEELAAQLFGAGDTPALKAETAPSHEKKAPAPESRAKNQPDRSSGDKPARKRSGRGRGGSDKPQGGGRQPQGGQSRGKQDARGQDRGSDKRPSRRMVHKAYAHSLTIVEGVTAGQVFIGQYRNYGRVGFVTVAGWDIDIVVDNKHNNRAFHMDEVAVRLLPREQWENGETMSRQKNDDKETASQYWAYYGDGLEAQAELKPLAEATASKKITRPTGEVIAIVKSMKPTTVVGMLRTRFPHEKWGETDRLSLIPLNDKLPVFDLSINSVTKALEANGEFDKNAMHLAVVQDWPADALHPKARYERCIGTHTDSEAITASIMESRGFDHHPWGEEILSELPGANYTIPESERLNRRDLTTEAIFTIDPTTAKDLDDALHIRTLKEGNHPADCLYEVGVHIADVSHFVKPDSALDRRASKNCTTVYLVDRAMPMLPAELSEQLCSLNPCADKLAFSVIWQQHGDGTLPPQDVWFGRTIIHPKARLSYEAAQDILDDEVEIKVDSTDISGWPVVKGFGPAVESAVRALWSIGSAVNKERASHGFLELNSNKLCFKLDDSGRIPLDTFIAPHMDSHSLVECFMVTANQLVARRLITAFPEAALLRSHIGMKKLEELVEEARSAGIQFNARTTKQITETLRKIRKDDDAVGAAFAYMAVRFHVWRAAYVTPAIGTEEALVHHGLGIPLYTHFTSPIRRYADIIVHRLLQAALDYEMETNKGKLRFTKRTRLFADTPPAAHRPPADAIARASAMASVPQERDLGKGGKLPKYLRQRRGVVNVDDDEAVFALGDYDEAEEEGEVQLSTEMQFLKDRGIDVAEINALLENINERTKQQQEAGSDSEEAFLWALYHQRKTKSADHRAFIVVLKEKTCMMYIPELDYSFDMDAKQLPASTVSPKKGQWTLGEVAVSKDMIGDMTLNLMDSFDVTLTAELSKNKKPVLKAKANWVAEHTLKKGKVKNQKTGQPDKKRAQEEAEDALAQQVAELDVTE